MLTENELVESPETETEQAEPVEEQQLEQEQEETEEQPAEEEQVEDEEPEIELVHNGKTVVKKLSDVKNLAQMGYDYSVKMQRVNAEQTEVSSLRQAVEAEKNTLAQQQERYLKSLEIVERLNQDGGVSEDELNKLLEEGDTEGYLKLKAQREKRMSALNVIKAEQEATLKVMAERQHAYLVEQQKKGQEVLREKMPHLLETKGASELYGYLGEAYGYSPDQIKNVADPNLFIMAEKARLYDQIAKQKTAPKPTMKAIKSKAAPLKVDPNKAKLNQSLERLKANPRDNDAAINALKQLI